MICFFIRLSRKSWSPGVTIRTWWTSAWIPMIPMPRRISSLLENHLDFSPICSREFGSYNTECPEWGKGRIELPGYTVFNFLTNNDCNFRFKSILLYFWQLTLVNAKPKKIKSNFHHLIKFLKITFFSRNGITKLNKNLAFLFFNHGYQKLKCQNHIDPINLIPISM